MNKEELIKTLLEQDLNEFCFRVWAKFNNEGDLEYAIALNGEKPYGYDINLCKVGGNPDTEYTYEYIDFWIDYAIDEFYDKRY
jgi:hypothetical protein